MLYEVEITTLNPLHIGTGDVLLRDYDYVTGGKQTWVLDRDAILAEEYDREEAGGRGIDFKRLAIPPGQLVRPDELREDSPYVRYALAGTTTIDQVREQIKDVNGQCYLPGSTLKGALRTVLMSHAVKSGAFKPDIGRLGEQREWAAQAWEEQVFGRDPNHDLLRALIVSDSEPLPRSPSPLMLLNAQVFAAGPPGAPIVVEAIKPDVTFKLTVRVDEYLFSEAAHKLGLANRRNWLENLAQIARDIGQEQIRRERAFIAGRRGLEATQQFYDRLAQARLPEGGFLLQIAWGAGWAAKTVSPWLPDSAQQKIRQRYNLGKPPRAGRDWKPDLSKPFPKSRRLRAARRGGEVVGDVPLGWVLVVFK